MVVFLGKNGWLSIYMSNLYISVKEMYIFSRPLVGDVRILSCKTSMLLLVYEKYWCLQIMGAI